MTTELDNLPDHIELDSIDEDSSIKLPKPKAIDISFFSHKTRKSTRLIDNASEKNYMKARREWMEFEFTEVIYVTTIEIFASGYEKFHSLDLRYRDLYSDEIRSLNANYENGSFKFAVNRFVSGFGLRPTTSFWKNSNLTSIHLQGIEQRHFSEVVSLLSDVNKEKQEVEDYLNQFLQKAWDAEANYQKKMSDIDALDDEIKVKQE